MRNKYIERNYRNRKMHERKFFIRIVLLLFVAFTLLCVCVTTYSKDTHSTKKVRVYAGDSLWNIAKENKYPGDIRKFVYEVKKINSMDSDMLSPGDIIEIPLY